jgi:hypothetical protein
MALLANLLTSIKSPVTFFSHLFLSANCDGGVSELQLDGMAGNPRH